MLVPCHFPPKDHACLPYPTLEGYLAGGREFCYVATGVADGWAWSLLLLYLLRCLIHVCLWCVLRTCQARCHCLVVSVSQGMGDCLRQIVAQEGGMAGLWRGGGPAVQRAALVNLGELATYDQVGSEFCVCSCVHGPYMGLV